MKNKTKRDMMTIQYKPRVDSFSCNGKTEYWPIIEIYRDNKLIDCIEDQSAGFTSYHAALELAKEEISQRLDAKKDVKIKTRLEIEKKEYFDFDFQRVNSPQNQKRNNETPLIKIHDYLASAQADLINRNKDKILDAISSEMIQDTEYYQFEYELMSLDLLDNPEYIKLDVRGHEIKLSQLASYIDIGDWGTDRYGERAVYQGSVGDIEFNDDLRAWAKILGFNRLHNIIKRLNKAGYHLEAGYSLYLVDSKYTSTYIQIDSGELYDLVDELKENFREAIYEAYTSYLDSRWSSIEEYFYSNERAQDIFDSKDNAELLEYLN